MAMAAAGAAYVVACVSVYYYVARDSVLVLHLMLYCES